MPAETPIQVRRGTASAWTSANPTLLAVGSNSIMLTKIIAAAAISNAIATRNSDNLFLITTISQPIMVLKAAKMERRKPIWLLARFTTRLP